MTLLENKYDLGQIVYLKTDPDQKERMITAIQLNLNGIVYWASIAESGSWHFEKELSLEKKFIKSSY